MVQEPRGRLPRTQARSGSEIAQPDLNTDPDVMRAEGGLIGVLVGRGRSRISGILFVVLLLEFGLLVYTLNYWLTGGRDGKEPFLVVSSLFSGTLGFFLGKRSD